MARGGSGAKWRRVRCPQGPSGAKCRRVRRLRRKSASSASFAEPLRRKMPSSASSPAQIGFECVAQSRTRRGFAPAIPHSAGFCAGSHRPIPHSTGFCAGARVGFAPGRLVTLVRCGRPCPVFEGEVRIASALVPYTATMPCRLAYSALSSCFSNKYLVTLYMCLSNNRLINYDILHFSCYRMHFNL